MAAAFSGGPQSICFVIQPGSQRREARLPSDSATADAMKNDFSLFSGMSSVAVSASEWSVMMSNKRTL